jgi:hypothetical protein
MKPLRTWLRKWGIFLVIPFGLVLFAYVDISLKQTDAAGFCPPDPLCTLSSNNIGEFWFQAGRQDATKTIEHYVPRPLAWIEYYVYTSTWIRPSSARWRIWMGPRFLAAYTSDGAGICVHPGLLLRTADWIHSWVAAAPDSQGVRKFRNHFFAWRDGFLIVSTSHDYIAKSLTADLPNVPPQAGKSELQFAWNTAPAGVLRIKAIEQFPIEGSVDIAIEPRKAPSSAALRFDGETPLLLQLPGPNDTAALWNQLAQNRPWSTSVNTFLTDVAEKWRLNVSALEWTTQCDEMAVALTGCEMDGGIPVPQLASVLRSNTNTSVYSAILPMFAAFELVPYEWDGQRGTVFPIFGERITLAVAEDGTDCVITSQTALMPKVLQREDDDMSGGMRDADVFLHLNWKPTAASAEKIALWMAETGLVPRMNRNDAERDWSPAFKAAALLGDAQVEAKMNGGRLEFRGTLVGKDLSEVLAAEKLKRKGMN